jgi:hypothetical protein
MYEVIINIQSLRDWKLKLKTIKRDWTSTNSATFEKGAEEKLSSSIEQSRNSSAERGRSMAAEPEEEYKTV